MRNKLLQNNRLLIPRNRYFGGGGYVPVQGIDTSQLTGYGNLATPNSIAANPLTSTAISPTQITVPKGPSTWQNFKNNIANSFKNINPVQSLGLDPNSMIAAGGAVLGSVLAGGKSSEVGDILNQAGSPLLGGLYNSIAGVKLNEENIAEVEQNIKNMKNFQSNAADYDNLAQEWMSAPTAMSFGKSYIGKDSWFNHGASKKFNYLSKENDTGALFVNNSLQTSAQRILNTNMRDLESNYNSAAYGGELNTQGGDFTNGIVYIDNGGTHEENPNQGVLYGVDQEGNPNLVEQGETVFNDYVFSNRINVPKQVRNKYKLRNNLTFAEASKKLSKESEERPNDPISKKGLQAFMQELALTQEYIKEQEQLKQQQQQQQMAAFGGKLFDIGGTTKENFIEAPNILPNIVGIPVNTSVNRPILNSAFVSSNLRGIKPLDINRAKEQFKEFPGANSEHFIRTENGLVPMPNSDIYYDGMDATSGKTWQEVFGDKYIRANNGSSVIYTDPKTGITSTRYFYDLKDNKNDKTPPLDTRMRMAPVYAGITSVITDALGLTNKPNYEAADKLEAALNSGTGYSPVTFTPDGTYMQYRPFDFDYLANQYNAANRATSRNIRNTANNRNTAIAAMIASDNNYLSKLGDQYRATQQYNDNQLMQVKDFNRKTNLANSEGFLKAAMANQSARAQSRNLHLSGLTNAAQMRENARRYAESNKAANINSLIKSMDNIGRENFYINQLNGLYDSNVFGTMDDNIRSLFGLLKQAKDAADKKNNDNSTTDKK